VIKMAEEQKLNLSISEGDAFFAHEISVNFNPTQFILDFKSVTPRIDPRSQNRATVVMKHNVVMLDPYHMKKTLDLLAKVMKKYETEFGKIEKPKSVEKFEKKHKKKMDDQKNQTKQTPTYFG